MKDLLKVSRFKFDKDWTIGRLFMNDVHSGYTVEDEIRKVKVKDETAIPAGRYELKTRISPHFSNTFYWDADNHMLIDRQHTPIGVKSIQPHELIWITNVPGFEFVLLHFGNTDLDSSGCLVVGDAIGTINGREGVIHSRDYYKRLYALIYPTIKKGGQFITVQ